MANNNAALRKLSQLIIQIEPQLNIQTTRITQHNPFKQKMRNSKRQIVISQITNSNLNTSQLKHKQNLKQAQMHNPFKNDLNSIQHNQSNLSNGGYSRTNSYLDDDDEEIIQSMKEKEKLLKEIQVLKAQANGQGNAKGSNKPTHANNKLSMKTKTKTSAKINTINSCDKKASLNQEKFMSFKPKAKPLMFNSSSSKTVGISKSQKHLLDHHYNSKKPQVRSSNTTVRKSINTVSNSYLNIVAPRKLQYDPDMLMKSPHKGSLLRKQKIVEVRTNDYGLPEYVGNAHSLFYTPEGIEVVKNNSHKIPFRFNF